MNNRGRADSLCPSAVQLRRRLEERSAQIVVMGLGYVGLPMAVQLATAGFEVVGLDPDTERVRQVCEGHCYVQDVAAELWREAIDSGRLRATCSPEVLSRADAVIICVPTPLTSQKNPNTAFIGQAAESIALHRQAPLLVVLESTTYPGFTEEELIPRLTKGDDVLGHDLFVAFSPERLDPGNRDFHLYNTPKILGGATAQCLVLAQALYQHAVAQLVPVSSTRCAEMVKLLENTFRAVNIGLVNEVAVMSRKLDIDAFEVVRAAATKPFGYMPFYPGPGLGGHCIPIDPLYLAWKLRTMNYEARFIQLADEVNTGMPRYVVERIATVLNLQRKPICGSRILIYGLAYKRNVSDCRQAPAREIVQLLNERQAQVFTMDPLVNEQEPDVLPAERMNPESSFSNYDLVVILTDHDVLPAERLLQQAADILDTRNALGEIHRPTAQKTAHVHSL